MKVEFNNICGQPPTHLGLEFFEEILENAILKPGAQIKKVIFEMGSSTGENYCSKIYRVKIKYLCVDGKSETCSTIIKSIPLSEATQFLQDLQVYVKEKIFYNNVLPLMEIFLPIGQQFGAKLYKTLRHPINTLAFEDLTIKHYQMASRESGLDEAHCHLVMKKLGKFHGISMVLANKRPEVMSSFDSGLLSKVGLKDDDGMLLKYFGGHLEALTELISNWSGYEQIYQNIIEYGRNLRENLLKSQAPIEGEIKVLNHGDLWVNNILFKYQDSESLKLMDLVFVDFQMSVWGSPGLDLNYFFYTSLQLSILQNNTEALVKVYHESLQLTLKELMYNNIPTLQDILLEVKRREPYGFFANFAIFPTISMNKQQSSDNSLDNFLDEEFAKKKVRQMFSSKRLEKTLQYTLPRFQNLGIFNEAIVN